MEPNKKILKAQNSVELMLIIAIGLLIFTAFLIVSNSYLSSVTSQKDMQDGTATVKDVASAADWVYKQGIGAKKQVFVNVPHNVDPANTWVGLATGNFSGNASDNEVNMRVYSTDVFATSIAPLRGSLPTAYGGHWVWVESFGDFVLIGQGLTCLPSLITRNFAQGQAGSDTVALTNNGDFAVTGLNASISGATTIVSTNSPQSNLSSNASANLTLSYNVPGGQAPGAYSATLLIDSENGGSCLVPITIQVSGNQTCGSICGTQGYSSGSCRPSASLCLVNGEDHISGNDPSCSGVPGNPTCCCYPTVDKTGPIVTLASKTPSNASSADPVTIRAVCDDTTTGGEYIKSADIQLDTGNWTSMSASGGAFYSSSVQNVSYLAGLLAAGQHVAAMRCTDTASNIGPTAFYYFNITTSDTLGPIVKSMNHSNIFPTTLANITEYCSATDAFTGNSNIAACYIKVDSGSWILAQASDGAYNSPNEDCAYNIGQMATGLHTVYAYCTDALNNSGGIANDTFGVSAADVMLIIDRSGSMSENFTDSENGGSFASNNSFGTTAWTSPASAQLNDNVYATASLATSTSSQYLQTTNFGFNVTSNATINGIVVTVARKASTASRILDSRVRLIKNGVVGATDKASATTWGTAESTVTYGTATDLWGTTWTSSDINSPNFGLAFAAQHTSNAGPHTASVDYVNITVYYKDSPNKIEAAKAAAKSFVSLVGSTSQVGLVSYSDTATTDKQLALMNSPGNINALDNAIDAIAPGGNTCIECGLDNARIELTSARGRYPNAVRVDILLTDGQSNVPATCPAQSSLDGASASRDNNITVYTIGLGQDVNDTELTNIALVTGGKYYYSPDPNTLQCIYDHIGTTNTC